MWSKNENQFITKALFTFKYVNLKKIIIKNRYLKLFICTCLLKLSILKKMYSYCKTNLIMDKYLCIWITTVASYEVNNYQNFI